MSRMYIDSISLIFRITCYVRCCFVFIHTYIRYYAYQVQSTLGNAYAHARFSFIQPTDTIALMRSFDRTCTD